MRFTLDVADGDWPAESARWQAQRKQFFIDLSRVCETSELPATQGKGAVEAIVIALGSAGVFSTLATMFHAWLAQRPKGTITVSCSDGVKTIESSVTNLPLREFERHLQRELLCLEPRAHER